MIHRLRQELGVEAEVVRVVLEGDRLEHLASVHAEAGVAVAEVLPEDDVHAQREHAVHEILQQGHPPFERLAPRPDA